MGYSFHKLPYHRTYFMLNHTALRLIFVWFWRHLGCCRNSFIMMIFKMTNHNVKRLPDLCINWAWQLIKILVRRFTELRNYNIINALSETSWGFPGSFKYSVTVNIQILETESLTCHHTSILCQTLFWFSFCRCETPQVEVLSPSPKRQLSAKLKAASGRQCGMKPTPVHADLLRR